jgi:WD40 repeat protein
MAIRILQAGSALLPNAVYVDRQADGDLLGHLAAGRHCYVLGSRQVGKTSLRIRTAQRLARRGITSVQLDLNSVGRVTEADSLLRWLATRIAEGSGLFAGEHEAAVASVWRASGRTTPVSRWSAFVVETLAPACAGPLVVFLDEIDALLALPERDSDDLFASLKVFADGRASSSTLGRVTFCLLGLAAPGDLMRDPSRTQLSIGEAVDLRHLARADLGPFETALTDLGLTGDAGPIVDEVFRWTNGDPYTTQSVCMAVLADEVEDGSAAERVERAVREGLLERGLENPVFNYTDRYLGNQNRSIAKLLPAMLDAYRRVFDGERLELRHDDPVQLYLRLSGIVSEGQGDATGTLVARNPIYRELFGAAWIDARAAEVESEEVRAFFAAPKEEKAKHVLTGEKLNVAVREVLGEGGAPSVRSEAYGGRVVEISPRKLELLTVSLEAARESAEALQKKAQLAERRTRVFLAIAVLAFLLALGVATFAVLQRARALEAEEKAKIAASEALIERNREERRRLAESATNAARNGRELDALVWALDAVVFEGRETEGIPTVAADALARAVTAARHSYPLSAHFRPTFARLSRDGSRAFTEGEKRSFLWDVKTRKVIAELPGDRTGRAFFLSANGRRLLTTEDQRPVALWEDGKTTDLTSQFKRRSPGRDRFFSADGLTLVNVSGEEPRLLVSFLDVRTGETRHQTMIGMADAITDPLGITGQSPLSTGSLPTAPFPGSSFSIGSLASSWPSGVPLPSGLPISSGSFPPASSRARSILSPIWALLMTQLSPDGRWLAAMISEQRMAVLDTQSGRVVKELAAGTSLKGGDTYGDVSFSEDGSRLAEASGKHVLVRSAPSFEPTTSFEAFDPVSEVYVDGESVVVAYPGSGGDLFREGKHAGKLSERAFAVTSVAFGEDGRFAVGHQNGAILLYQDGYAGPAVQLELRGHRGSVTKVGFVPGGGLVSAASDDTVRLWELGEGRFPRENRPMSFARFSPAGDLVVTATSRGMLRVYGPDGAPLWSSGGPAHMYLDDLALSPGGDRIAAVKFGSVIVHDTLGGWQAALPKQEQAVCSATFSPDGQWLAGGSREGKILLWNADGQLVWSGLHGEGDVCVQTVFSPDGSMVLSYARDDVAQAWDVRGGYELFELHGHVGPIDSASFTPDGASVITAAADGRVRRWSVARCRGTMDCRDILWQWQQGSPALATLLWPDGGTLAVSDQDGVIRLLRASDGKLLRTLRGHEGSVRRLQISADATRLISGGDDGTTLVWRLDPEVEEAPSKSAPAIAFPGDGGRLTSLALAPDGKRVLTAYDDGTARIDDVTTEGLVVGACQLLAGPFEADFAKDMEGRTGADPEATDANEDVPQATVAEWRRARKICDEWAPRLR